MADKVIFSEKDIQLSLSYVVSCLRKLISSSDECIHCNFVYYNRFLSLVFNFIFAYCGGGWGTMGLKFWRTHIL